jgi:hypothetical protein
MKVASAMAAQPDASLPQQTGNWGDLLGAYRLFNNAAVAPEAIGQSHWQMTRDRCRGHRVVLCVQDTSEMDYSGYKAKRGLGPIGRENGQGFLQHSALAVLPSGQLLGVLHQRWQVRVEAPENETRQQRRERWNEGQFWPEAVVAVGPAPEGTRFITVTDRGGDSFDTFAACDRMNHGFIVRAQHDRCVRMAADEKGEDEKQSAHLWSWMERRPVLRTIQVKVPARGAKRTTNKGLGGKSQPARQATVQVRSGYVLLEAPKGDPQHKLPRWVWVVYAREINAPPHVSEPIDWMLLSSEPVQSVRQALRIINWYRRRWVIEEYHKVQKSGCGLEHSQLEDVDALRRLAALVGVVAVRMLWLRDLASASLSTVAADAGESGKKPPAPGYHQRPAALQALIPMIWITVAARLAKVADARQLTPQQFWRTIAQRGGWLGRKHDSRPGWKTLWRGWHDVALLVEGAELLSAVAAKSCV